MSLMGDISAIVLALEVYSQYFIIYKLDGFSQTICYGGHSRDAATRSFQKTILCQICTCVEKIDFST